jgi:hypothetical protein
MGPRPLPKGPAPTAVIRLRLALDLREFSGRTDLPVSVDEFDRIGSEATARGGLRFVWDGGEDVRVEPTSYHDLGAGGGIRSASGRPRSRFRRFPRQSEDMRGLGN